MDTELKEAISKIKGKEFPGSSVKDGTLYHDIPFEGFEDVNSHRKNNLIRWNMIKNSIPFVGKTVIDMCCNTGAMSLLSASIYAKEVTGYDYDNHAIEVAELIKNRLGFKNVNFRVQKIDLDFIKSLDKVDIILALSCVMWFYKEYGTKIGDLILLEMSRKADIMVFEIAAGKGDGMAAMPNLTQDKVIDFLKERTIYTEFINLGPAGDNWKSRNIVICKR
jgi:SAM-dependent methyltransferase